MSKPTLPPSPRSQRSGTIDSRPNSNTFQKVSRKKSENSDVLISAVISPYLLTHLHHVLQGAEFRASKEGRLSQAANFAQLRKVLCMDARSMKDASASGVREEDMKKFHQSKIASKVA